jgi:hypothetical protein
VREESQDEPLQPARFAASDPASDTVYEARDAYDPSCAPEEEGSLRGLEEEDEDEIDDGGPLPWEDDPLLEPRFDE